jgi:hypothetical protein
VCTMIAVSTAVRGSGKGAAGWFRLTKANVGFDHATHGDDEHALLLDFVNPELGPSARVAVELDIESGKALIEQIQAAIDAAEASGVTE